MKLKSTKTYKHLILKLLDGSNMSMSTPLTSLNNFAASPHHNSIECLILSSKTFKKFLILISNKKTLTSLLDRKLMLPITKFQVEKQLSLLDFRYL